MEQHSRRCYILNRGDDSCSRWFRLLKFIVYMELVVFEVESLSKDMTNMNHMSFDKLIFSIVFWFNLLHRFRSVLTL